MCLRSKRASKTHNAVKKKETNAYILDEKKLYTSVFFKEASATQALDSRKSPAKTATCNISNYCNHEYMYMENLI